ncbi:unnamed protein product [Oncorhynchus mykiss]|uniref:Leucine-rich repeat flightless-interacting protein 2 n=1 Tax=Oncorhynchus mykiss TaxID=8022 RepID=A0A060VUG1_ONCMY|nr:unnamed protein product [Oncorhynchus mykiss]
MGTPGRKRAPIKDRFSAEDEALSSIAREAEARLAAKRVARAEARDIRMRELERQQKELSSRHSSSSSRKSWGSIHQWMQLQEGPADWLVPRSEELQQLKEHLQTSSSHYFHLSASGLSFSSVLAYF